MQNALNALHHLIIALCILGRARERGFDAGSRRHYWKLFLLVGSCLPPFHPRASESLHWMQGSKEVQMKDSGSASYQSPPNTSQSFSTKDEEEEDEEIAKQLAKAIKVCLSGVPNKQNTSYGKHMGGIVAAFKVKGPDAVEENATRLEIPEDKCLSMTGPEEQKSWTPEVHFTSSTTRSKCDSEKTINKSSQGLDKHLIEASTWKIEKQLQDGLLVPPTNPKKLNKLIRKQVKDTLGTKWFNMPAQVMTPELKKDLQLLKLRNVVDPKRHYKADDSKGLPKYFQVGTVIEPATEFYSGRLTKKEQKPTIADELLSNPDLSRYRKRKHAEFDKQKNTFSRKGRKLKKHSHKHGR